MPDKSVFEERMNEVREDIREVRSAMGKIADAITRMAVLEERHRSTDDRMVKVEERLRDVEKKSGENEKSHLKLIATINGIASTSRVLWLVGGTVIGGLAIKLFSSYLHL